MTVDDGYDDGYDYDNDYDDDYGYDDGENTLCKRPSITPNQKRRHNMTSLQIPPLLGEMEGASPQLTNS